MSTLQAFQGLQIVLVESSEQPAGSHTSSGNANPIQEVVADMNPCIHAALCITAACDDFFFYVLCMYVLHKLYSRATVC